MKLQFGNTSVPWTVSWSDEEQFFVAECKWFKRRAVCQSSKIGVGKPMFGKPHMNRQRQAIAQGLCDLCGKSLKLSTKISLSHARPVPHSAGGMEILQVEPLLHKDCAAASMRFCPSLKRDIEQGTLMVRQVLSCRAQGAIMTDEFVASVTGRRCKALGHAKVQLVKWIDRDMAWLVPVAQSNILGQTQ